MISPFLKRALGDAWLRLRPALAVFFGVQLLVRVTLLARVVGEVGGVGNMLAAVAIGALMDAVIAAFWMVPLLLVWLCTQRRSVLGGVVFFASFMWGFTAVSEHVFWTEFGVRFNFIAVDYLVYTTEVIGNIRESYPMPLLVACITLAASVLTWWQLRRMPRTTERPALRWRAATLAVWLLGVAGLLGATASRFADFSSNQYANELARNGTYALFYAYDHNEIDYASFYATMPEAEAHTLLRAELSAPHSTLVASEGGDPTHIVTAHIPEQRKNVMLVVMESLSGAYMGALGHPDFPAGLTPNLDALAKDGLFFDHLYATGTRTVRGLEAVTLSLPPTPGQSILRRNGNEHLFSIADVFNDRGYHSQFLYGGHGAFDNMGYFYANNGFEVVDRPTFAENEIRFANAWGGERRGFIRQSHSASGCVNGEKTAIFSADDDHLQPPPLHISGGLAGGWQI